MSWIDRLENIKFSITTGDGKIFKPLWKNGEKSKEFNISKYDFINVEGSLIDRKKAQSNSYPLVFWFQGEDNIEQAQDFEDSANDSRLWTVEHPFYGTIKGQPVNLKRNDSSYNVTEVSVDFWESINGEFPLASISVEDEVRSKVSAVNTSSASFFLENATPSTGDINNVKQNAILSASNFTADTENFSEFNNISSKAIKSADSLVTDIQNYSESIQDLVNFPATFNTSAKSRIGSYEKVYEVLKDSLGNLFSKYNFESQSADAIAGVCLSCITPQENDYITRSDIEIVNAQLIALYDDYLQTLDSIQVDIYDVENTYSPNVQIQSDLAQLVLFTSNSLFLLGFNARQERSFELEKDSNLIILTHRLLGLDATDSNINTFKELNQIKGRENFKIRKGRTIKYFVE